MKYVAFDLASSLFLLEHIFLRIVQLYLRLSGQFPVCLFFFYEKILSVKKAPNAKQTIFTVLKAFVVQKIVAFVV